MTGHSEAPVTLGMSFTEMQVQQLARFPLHKSKAESHGCEVVIYVRLHSICKCGNDQPGDLHGEDEVCRIILEILPACNGKKIV